MRALTVEPGRAASASLRDTADPVRERHQLLVEALAVGICGTDRDIVDGRYGSAPPGSDYLVLGHESLGRVLEAPGDARLQPGDLVVPFVRRPDPVPCRSCAAGQWDMCRNGRYTEHGIKGLHGFCVDRYVVEGDAIVHVPGELGLCGVLVEPASVVAKAWDHIDTIGGRAAWFPQRVLVTGAGPIGLLAAMFAAQRGYDVHVLDVVSTGPKPSLVRDLGATYHVNSVAEACIDTDIVVECTGVARVVFDVLTYTRPAGVVCLTGISSDAHHLKVDASAVNRELVLENDVVFGTVNANADHYRSAVEALTRADRGWLRGLIARVEPMDRWDAALEGRPEDVKTIIDIGWSKHVGTE